MASRSADLPGHRPALAVDRHTQSQLEKLRPAVPGVSTPANLGLFLPEDLGRGGIQREQIQLLAEQILVPEEELPFQIRPDIREKPRGSAEVLKGELLPTGTLQALEPPTPLEIASRLTEPLEGQSVLSLGSQGADPLRDPLPLPESVEHQRGSPDPGLPGGDLRVLGGGDDAHGPRESRQALQQGLDWAGGLERVEATQRVASTRCRTVFPSRYDSMICRY